MSGGWAPAGRPARDTDADDGLTTWGHAIGGAGDVEVSTDHIRERAAVVRALARDAEDVGSRCRRAAAALTTSAGLTAIGPLALDSARLAALRADALGAELDNLAAALDGVAAHYEATEAAAEATILDVGSLRPPLWMQVMLPVVRLNHLGVVAGLAMGDAVAHGQLPWQLTRHGAGMLLEELVWVSTGLDDGIPWVAGRLSDAVRLSGVSDEAVVTEVAGPYAPAGPGRTPVAVPHGPVPDVAGVVGAIGGLYPQHGRVPPGTVRVDRIEAPDGAVSWLVLVPGTQGDWAGPNPNSWAGNIPGMIGRPSSATALVVQAIRSAGIRPGEPVMIAGHSQGGMVAINAANAVAGRVDVSGVVTVGAPTGLLDAPDGTEVLSLEHTEDPTPGLDDEPNPVAEDWTTVARTLPDVDGRLGTWRDAHDIPAYVETADLVDASDDHAILDFLAENEAVLTDDAVVTTEYYQGVRP